ncbi:hypothetical protein D3C79_676230 [compost metagenome]
MAELRLLPELPCPSLRGLERQQPPPDGQLPPLLQGGAGPGPPDRGRGLRPVVPGLPHAPAGVERPDRLAQGLPHAGAGRRLAHRGPPGGRARGGRGHRLRVVPPHHPTGRRGGQQRLHRQPERQGELCVRGCPRRQRPPLAGRAADQRPPGDAQGLLSEGFLSGCGAVQVLPQRVCPGHRRQHSQHLGRVAEFELRQGRRSGQASQLHRLPYEPDAG